MEDIICDGEVHAISQDYGYICNRIFEKLDKETLSDYVNQQLIKFIDYLYINDKEKIVDYLINIFNYQVIHNIKDENYDVIFRPEIMSNSLAQFSTLALKFKRAENDNLEVKSEQV